MKVEVDLSQDAFTVTYDPSLVTRSAIAQEIVELGFVPRVEPGGKPVPSSLTPSTAGFPEPVASALVKARETRRPLFADFYAEFCAPCKIIEGRILPDSPVQARGPIHSGRLRTLQLPTTVARGAFAPHLPGRPASLNRPG